MSIYYNDCYGLYRNKIVQVLKYRDGTIIEYGKGKKPYSVDTSRLDMTYPELGWVLGKRGDPTFIRRLSINTTKRGLYGGCINIANPWEGLWDCLPSIFNEERKQSLEQAMEKMLGGSSVEIALGGRLLLTPSKEGVMVRFNETYMALYNGRWHHDERISKLFERA